MLTGRISRPRLGFICHGWLAQKYSQRHDPLRILFCGSDEFSAVSLKALHASALANPQRIASIDVICRPPKRVGRGRKELSRVPIKDVAESLQLRIHERDTFTGWKPPADINLIVAVSFGLFVPRRILNGAKYGGLNIHPSLLPDLRGPAPIQHALLRNYTYTGVSLQTLSTEDFDQGAILAQTPNPGVQIPARGECTVDELQSILAEEGAKMLVGGIQDQVFVPPIQPVKSSSGEVHHAGKITPEMRKLDMRWDADEILRRQRVLGPLWTMATRSDRCDSIRVVVSDIQRDSTGAVLQYKDDGPEQNRLTSLIAFQPADSSNPPTIGLISADGCFLRIGSITADGLEKMDSLKAVKKAKLALGAYEAS